MNQKQKTIIPEVRYHPTIQVQTSGHGPRTRPRRIKTRPPAAPEAGPDSKVIQESPDLGRTPVAEPAPPARPRPDRRQKHRAAGDFEGQVSDRAPPRPDQVPPGVGVQLDQQDVDEVERLTRGQRTNQVWFDWRKNRITASVAHSIAHSRFANKKSKTPPPSYLAAVTGDRRRVQTRAMTWGINMETKAVQRYQRMKSAILGRPVSVEDCGLFIDALRPWLAASPDGVVTDSSADRWLLEVKCPYKHRHSRVEEACRDDRGFCLEVEDGHPPGASPVYRLKRSHSYFTQIQCQLAVTGLQRADLAVFTTKELAIVQVTFDPDLWEETLSKLELFYRDAVLPHLRGKTQRDAVAAWTPEA